MSRYTLIAAALLAACSGKPEMQTKAADTAPPQVNVVDTVTATITYRQRMALPNDAHVMVALIDVARADAPAHVISGEDRVAAGQQVPFVFALPYVLSQIPMSARLAVQARIEQDGKLLFLSTQAYPVVTQGAPSSVELVLEPAGKR